jgi:hypothetical protein
MVPPRGVSSPPRRTEARQIDIRGDISSWRCAYVVVVVPAVVTVVFGVVDVRGSVVVTRGRVVVT